MRTPLSAVSCFTGQVDLSKNGWRAGSMDMSTTAPMRNPSRMPFFTQAFTRQPLCADASGSAARIAPAFSACFEALEQREMFVGVRARVFRRTAVSISACMHAPRAAAGPGSRAPSRSSAGSAGDGATQRQAPHRLAASPSAPSRPSPGSDSTRRNSLPSAAAIGAAAHARLRNRRPARAASAASSLPESRSRPRK